MNTILKTSDAPIILSELPRFKVHPERLRINAEFHARPPLRLYGPTLVSHLVFLHAAGDIALAKLHLDELNSDGSWRIVESSDEYVLFHRGDTLLRYELHTEFSSYTFFHTSPCLMDKREIALKTVPNTWLSAIPGQLLVATHIELKSEADVSPQQKIADVAASNRQTVVSNVVDGKAWIFSDFQIEDDASHFVMIDCGLTPRQAGRTVQRLWEIETYRVTALLGLPVAKAIALRLRDTEEQLADLMDRISSTCSVEDERTVLDELTQLAAEVEHSLARTSFRFSASRAYEAIVMQRVGELRETRVQGFPTLREILDRRLMPPMHTCAAMARRQVELSGRVARNSQLLRTRVDLALRRHNQLVLVQMNKRAQVQLRLQETVERLSIVAITYYGSQLIYHLAHGAATFWPAISPEFFGAMSIPAIAIGVALGLKRMHLRLSAVLATE